MSRDSFEDLRSHPPSPCPICHSGQPRRFMCPAVLAGTEPVYTLVECSNCGVRHLDPLPTPQELNRFYAPQYYGADWYKQEGRGRVFGRAMLPKGSTGKLLDVGCGLGYFLSGIRQSSVWQIYGVEISPEAVAFAREKLDLDVRCGELTAIGYPESFFDYLHVSNVLEHVPDPIGFLGECRRIMHQGGQLFLSVPNGPADSAGLVRYYRSVKQPPRSKAGHLFFFSQNALLQLFQKTGFRIVSSHTFGIRRGLSALGYYPSKPGWRRHYRAHAAPPAIAPIRLPDRKKRLPGYYAYRFWQARLKMLPGLWRIGLDFEIILQAE
jgi:SAM-dependent methyltransferase